MQIHQYIAGAALATMVSASAFAQNKEPITLQTFMDHLLSPTRSAQEGTDINPFSQIDPKTVQPLDRICHYHSQMYIFEKGGLKADPRFRFLDSYVTYDTASSLDGKNKVHLLTEYNSRGQSLSRVMLIEGNGELYVESSAPTKESMMDQMNHLAGHTLKQHLDSKEKANPNRSCTPIS